LAQILFKKPFKQAILDGRKTTTLRRWQKCSLKAGERVFAPGVGWLILEEVNRVEWEDLTDADARADGFSTLQELHHTIRKIYPDHASDGKTWYRLRFKRPTQEDAQAHSKNKLAAKLRRALDKAVRQTGS
jgi:hypothetical protein